MFSDQYTTDPNCCQSPVAEVVPEETEIYISWPELALGTDCTNTRTLVINYQYSSVDIVDHGFSVFRNFRPAQAAGPGCNTVTQYFLAASCQDLCLKNIGVGFAREICTNPGGTGAISNGIYVPTTGTYQLTGYYSVLRAAAVPELRFAEDDPASASGMSPERHPVPKLRHEAAYRDVVLGDGSEPARTVNAP